MKFDKLLNWVPLIGVFIYAITDYNTKSKEADLLEAKRKQIAEEVALLVTRKNDLEVQMSEELAMHVANKNDLESQVSQLNAVLDGSELNDVIVGINDILLSLEAAV